MRATLVALGWVGVVLLAGCGGGSGSGGGGAVIVNPVILTTAELEPNDTPLTATPLPFGTAGVGDLPFLNEIDYWSFTAQQDEVISIEVFGIRLDQAGWDAGGNSPRLRLFGPPAGATLELDHNHTSWSHGPIDLDIVCFRIPVTGTYFACIDAENPAFVSGRYAVLVTKPTGFDNLQTEAEPIAMSGLNDTPGSAETIEPGVMHGFHSDDMSDYYKFEITEPSIVHFDLCCYRNGVWQNDDDIVDPRMDLYDADGTTLLIANDDTCFYDPAIGYKFVNPGTYFIEVSECCGDGDGVYFLTYTQNAHGNTQIDSEPNDVVGNSNDIVYGDLVSGQVGTLDDDFFGFDGTAGDAIQLTFWQDTAVQNAPAGIVATLIGPDGTTPVPTGSDFVGGSVFSRFAILTETGRHYVRIATTGTATPYCFELKARIRATNESEPNNLIVDAEDLDANAEGAGAGFIAAGDQDIFRFSTTTNELICFEIWGNTATAGDTHPFGRTLQPQLNIGLALPEWVWLPTFSVAGGVKPCEGPSLTGCFIAPGGGSAIATVTRQPGAPIDANDVYVIKRR